MGYEAGALSEDIRRAIAKQRDGERLTAADRSILSGIAKYEKRMMLRRRKRIRDIVLLEINKGMTDAQIAEHIGARSERSIRALRSRWRGLFAEEYERIENIMDQHRVATSLRARRKRFKLVDKAHKVLEDILNDEHASPNIKAKVAFGVQDRIDPPVQSGKSVAPLSSTLNVSDPNTADVFMKLFGSGRDIESTAELLEPEQGLLEGGYTDAAD